MFGFIYILFLFLLWSTRLINQLLYNEQSNLKHIAW